MFPTSKPQNALCSCCIPLKIGIGLILLFELLQAILILITSVNDYGYLIEGVVPIRNLNVGGLASFVVTMIGQLHNKGEWWPYGTQYYCYTYGIMCIITFILGCIAVFTNKSRLTTTLFRLFYQIKTILVCIIFVCTAVNTNVQM